MVWFCGVTANVFSGSFNPKFEWIIFASMIFLGAL